jgi:plastocyanin
MIRRTALVAAAVVPALLLAPAIARAQSEPEERRVTIVDFSYGPDAITVTPGSKVTWRNDGPSTHTATASDSSFDTGLLKPGDSASTTFNQLGSFKYTCTLHPDMQGYVAVRSVGSSVDDPGDLAADRDKGVERDPNETDAETDHPRTGSDLGPQLLIGVLLLLAGANARRFLSPHRI